MKSSVTVKLDQTRINPFLTELSDLSARAAAARVRDRARANAPKRTGAGAASIGYRKVSSDPRGSTYRVGPSKTYMTYQEFGTGPIRARPGGVLRFQGRSGVFVFTRRTRGVPARHFMRDAYQALSVADFKP